MTYSELNRVLTSVDRGLRDTHPDQQAAAYVRANINSIVERLKGSNSITFEVEGRNYLLDREQLKRALR